MGITAGLVLCVEMLQLSQMYHLLSESCSLTKHSIAGVIRLLNDKQVLETTGL
ncbi:hypothetical protein ACN4EG_05420 [Alkalinema pantanalense CENA528]|uniref:hypothetical protein n=1 Tax=Alkalinema pantanalense TaxID=1620705 RepID=UPI003D6E1D90